MESVTVRSPLSELKALGQSVWLDSIDRQLIVSGELKRLIEQDGLGGLTSNPAIFEKAIAGGQGYEDFLAELLPQSQLPAKALYERLAIRDIQDAADSLRTVYESTSGADGYVSLEVSPFLAYETEPTVAEARRLWKAVDRPNLLVKVPATPEGIAAIEQLVSEGINVNATLLFSRSAYEQVARAYVRAATRFAAAGGDPSRLAGVASFFVSRIDTAVDARIEAAAARFTGKDRERLLALRGQAAVANAKLAYLVYQEVFSSEEWKRLAAQGAKPQRLLWASTSSKNPAYRDTIYVEELIGPGTVTTLPPATLKAFREHGKAKRTLTEDVEGAARVLNLLEREGIRLEEVTAELLRQGVAHFSEAFHKLLCTIEGRRMQPPQAASSGFRFALPAAAKSEWKAQLERWQMAGRSWRLWEKDASVWTGGGEASWLGWLDLPRQVAAGFPALHRFAAEIRRAGFQHAVLLGMGGSSLCPEVLSQTFRPQEGFPKLLVLDSTDPAQVRSIESAAGLEKTFFIVASKSGTTLEPNVFLSYFYHRVRSALGVAEAQRRFAVITDPESKLEDYARREGFRYLFYGVRSVGGRFSALSNFGLVPAAAMGLDFETLVSRAARMADLCAPAVAPEQNPGVMLGLVLGAAWRKGYDKLTLIVSPRLGDFGAWLEQLVAESTGKSGKAIIPVDREPLCSPEEYSNDRLFVYIRDEGCPDAAQDAAAEALENAGRPVARLAVADLYDLGQEFFRWEVATAVAGSVMEINPFDQPDVEASKLETRKLTSEYEQTGKLPEEKPFFEQGQLALFASEAYGQALISEGGDGLAGILRAHFDRLSLRDYFALLGYIEMNSANEAALQRIRTAVLEKKRVATCLGFGPRFLHSTGQAYKGGPNTGVFLQVTCQDAVDLPVPGQKYTFGVVKAAQARGDFQVLVDRGRRALRVHICGELQAGLAALEQAVRQALAGKG